MPGNTTALAALNATTAQMPFIGLFNFTITGTFVGTVELQRSFDSGVTYVPVSKGSSGNAADYTTPASLVVLEPEPGILYRAIMLAYTSGTATVRLSQ